MRANRFTLVALLVFLGMFTLPLFAADNANDASTNNTTTATAPAPAPAPEAKPEQKPAETKATTPAPVTPGPASPAPGSPFQIKVGDATLRFGLLLQPQVDFTQNTAGGTGQNFLIRRARFLIGGQVTKTVFFFFETENSRLGNANAQGQKSWTTGFQTLDAAAEWRPNKKFNISGGLIRVPTSRDALESASSEFTLDFNSYAFTATGALMGNAGRDNGIMFRGYFLDDRLEYRAAVVSGYRENGIKNTFRRVGRVQYNFFEKEVYNFPSYTGNNFGKKKILAVGAGYDQQLDYHGMTADVFGDIPTKFGSVLGTATYQKLDGNVKLKSQLAESDIFTADAGAYLSKYKFGPWVRYERRDFAFTNTEEKRVIAGVSLFPQGNNFNVKVGYGRFTNVAGVEMDNLVVQLQLFYY